MRRLSASRVRPLLPINTETKARLCPIRTPNTIERSSGAERQRSPAAFVALIATVQAPGSMSGNSRARQRQPRLRPPEARNAALAFDDDLRAPPLSRKRSHGRSFRLTIRSAADDRSGDVTLLPTRLRSAPVARCRVCLGCSRFCAEDRRPMVEHQRRRVEQWLLRVGRRVLAESESTCRQSRWGVVEEVVCGGIRRLDTESSATTAARAS